MDAKRAPTTRAHTHTGICRHCFGTGEVSYRGAAPQECPECQGAGALP
ncbi:MAG TPA: hypothetical protein VHH36_00880 [Candidatus Thermoplasmatota archaeon]|nr:hypothetical protein [Candidatus Thermoplasmatota archaeon]